MHLKKIEINGFKSFANQTQIDLETGVTGIVGPNGSGKSNITESLRWVLGEQSAKSLRGAKMPDIIFAGSSTRKALGMAEVTLTLDNTDHYLNLEQDEIIITRRLFKTGDSEFLINKKKVRLKDIQGLFMDTGLGRDSFSIISQGKVEEIFNSKPEERRGIFEEAAGVLKYKVRKKEAATKIIETNENIERLTDIIHELDQQLLPLKAQSEKAKRYLELYDSFKAKDIELNLGQIQEFKTELIKNNAHIEELTGELAALNQLLEQHENENTNLKTRRREVERALEESQNQLLITTQLISELENKIKLTEERKSFNQQNLSEKVELKEAKIVEKEQLTTELVALESENLAFEGRISQLKQTVLAAEEEMKQFAQSPEKILEQLRADYLKTVKTEADLTNEQSLLAQEKENTSQALTEQNEKLANLNEVLQTSNETLADLKTNQQQQDALLAKQLRKYQTVERELVDLNLKQDKLQKHYFAKLDEIRRLQSKLESLKSIQDTHANYYRGVKEILNHQADFKGLIGTVADLIDFDAEIEVAVEVALSGVAQQLVVENEKVAAHCIQFLKDKKLGRATFLPLTTVKARQINPNLQQTLANAEGFVGILSEMISYDKQIKPVFDYLVGTTVVATDFNAANRLAKLARFQVRIVTLTGEVVTPSGSMSGGSRNKQTSFFTKKEINDLTEMIATGHKAIALLENQLAAAKEAISSTQVLLEELRRTGEDERLVQKELTFKIKQMKVQCEDLTTERLLINKAIAALDMTNFDTQLNKLADKLGQIGAKKLEIDQEVKEISASKDAVLARRSKLEQAYHQYTAKLQVEEVKARQIVQEISRHQAAIEQLSAELRQFEAFHQSIKRSESEQLDSIQTLEGELEKALEKKESFETKQVRLRFERDDYEAQLEENSEQFEMIRNQAQEKQTKISTYELEIKQLKNNLNDKLLYLVEEYQLNDQAQSEVSIAALAELPALKREVSDLRKQIKELGNINLDAIAQYEEINERFTFLFQQREDLEGAKALLENTMSEMDDEVKTRFISTFEAIRHAFKKTFPQMFNGGFAELILTDPDDLLGTGIEIEVEPPGKKIQSLNLMSGGEKALTALSLLFAIIKVRTMPFVVLDEVEAALDEANVARFGHYLQTFENKNQFIVVTHRKGTMAACDVLYGVTMHESGVSKIVSVKLKKAEELVS
ncbi:MAG: chromosome segregation protein SMC [Streptococcaceae bacterium]|jgi:chromosome segregation protein|nr:chromosome segregation protein SMC [Streptococcaceae bacterium]